MAEQNEGGELDAFKRAVQKRIVADADRLVDELFSVAYDPEVDAKVRMTAISMLLDRGIPKLGVQHTKEDETEEKPSHKELREEIEELMRKKEEEEGRDEE